MLHGGEYTSIDWNMSDAIFSPSKTGMAMVIPAVPLLPALERAEEDNQSVSIFYTQLAVVIDKPGYSQNSKAADFFFFFFCASFVVWGAKGFCTQLVCPHGDLTAFFKLL